MTYIIRFNRVSKRLRTLLSAVCGVLAISSFGGCRSIIGPPAIPHTARSAPAMPYTISKDELVARLHQNADRVDSWISRDCHMTIKTPQMPVRLKATIACEESRNFRLVADGSLVVRADIGSNDDFCWWWMQPGDNVLFTVSHGEMDYVRNHPMMKQAMSMPFEPDWLMEVLGVTRLSTDGIVLHRDPHPERVNLVSEYSTDDGRVYRRVTLVDLHAGNVIGHRIVDSASNTIARAELSDYVFEGGASLPTRIEIDWPALQMSLAITVKNLSVNGELSDRLWEPPPSESRVNLAQHLRHRQRAPHQFRPIEMRPESRPSERPVYNDGQVMTAGGETEEEMQWEDDPPVSKWRWFRWPFSKR